MKWNNQHKGDWYPKHFGWNAHQVPNPIRPDELIYFLPFHGDSMFEMGGKVNLHVPGWDHKKKQWTEREITYKEYLLSVGFKRHVSVDFDPRWADHVLDLRKPLWDKFGKFSMVTNIGTSEHVSDQRALFENVHRMTEVGGLYIHLTPYPGGQDWPVHGQHYPTYDFFHSFAELNGWAVEMMGSDIPGTKHKQLYCRMRKTEDRPFTMPDKSLIYFNARGAIG
jgi:hypothetical protein